MGMFDLDDRISWQQACRILGCSRSTIYRLVRQGRLAAYGAAGRCRFFLKSECMEILKRKSRRMARSGVEE